MCIFKNVLLNVKEPPLPKDNLFMTTFLNLGICQ